MNLNIIQRIFPLVVNQELLEYDIEGIWSISLPYEADLISLIIIKNINSNNKIFDGTGGLGGNIISLCKYFNSVTSCEIDESRYRMLENNIKIFNLDNINLINGNCIDYLDDDYDAYLFDPPWGGPGYKSNNKITIKLGNLNLVEVVNKIRINNNSPIFFKLPNNYDLNEFDEFNYIINKIKNYLLISIF
jgi:16S rRNA G966 N2-methylase RsmD